jgi:hypothetical protein
MNGPGHDVSRALLRHVSVADPTGGFELPLPPQGLGYPHAAQLVATVFAGSILALVVPYALWERRRTRSPLMLVS